MAMDAKMTEDQLEERVRNATNGDLLGVHPDWAANIEIVDGINGNSRLYAGIYFVFLFLLSL
jgi:hypothetical protein